MIEPGTGTSRRFRVETMEDVLGDMDLLQQIGTPLDRVDYHLAGPGGYADGFAQYTPFQRVALMLEVARQNPGYAVFREIK